ncbi:GSCOCG00010697001-RA-CDS [Cotesia congregata]|nr:GSCOCG00010697001-RA-CDS [Cotesia congregata]
MTISRLELSAAWLLTQLILHVKEVQSLENVKINFWTDSTVIFTWIKSPASASKFIPGKQNPADCASRGIPTLKLKQHALRIWHRVIDRFKTVLKSSLAYPFTPSDLERAKLTLIKFTQGQFFAREIHTLQNGDSLLRNNCITKLTPFIDHQGALRVGGRLKHALLDPEEKHPAFYHDIHRLHQSSLMIRTAKRFTKVLSLRLLTYARVFGSSEAVFQSDHSSYAALSA